VPVSVNSDGTFTYDPTGVAVIQQLTTGQTLVDTFTYTATDGLSASAPGTVSLTITGSNDPPEAKNDAVLVRVNTATNLNVLSNDSDVDGTINIGSVTIVTGPSNGTASVNPNGTILYTPGANFNGVDTLTYTVKDQQGATSNVANVTINVNHFPVAVDDAFVVPIDAVNHKLSILANDSDQDGSLDPSSITIQVFPTNGSLVFNSTDPTAVFYTPNSGFTGTDSFTYTVADNLGAVSNVANVRITVSNSPHRNPTNPFDVNADGVVSPIDALILINEINRNGSRALPIPPVAPDVPPPYLDPTGDNTLSPNDVGVIITELNRIAATQSAEGEAAAETVAANSLASESLVAASLASDSTTSDAALSPSLLSAPEQTVRQSPGDLHTRLVDHLLASSPRTLPGAGLNSAAGQDDFDSILDEITTEVDRKRRSLASDVALEDLLWGDDRRMS
ncbi:MAG: tandem-95 repeat protein, partial [Planctomycetales bacterium]|nr:tandem-95 repeat protein [Planctomycetales bacterium]